MAFKSYRDHSKDNWGTQNATPTNEQLTLGCLMRIADALETVSKNYNGLITDRDFYLRRYREESAENIKLMETKSKDAPME